MPFSCVSRTARKVVEMTSANIQRNIIRNMFISEFTYVVCVSISFIAFAMGLVDLSLAGMILFPAVQITGFLAFVGVVLKGWNARLNDPGMTFPQIMFTMLTQFPFLFFVDTSVRGTMMLMFCIPSAYVVFRITYRKSVVLIATVVLLQLSLWAALTHLKPHQADFRVEMIRTLLIVCVSAFFTYLAGYAYRIRGRLANRKRDLEAVNLELKQAQQDLSVAAHRAGMAEVASDVLHQVGHLLNSMNVSHTLAFESTQALRSDLLRKLALLVDNYRTNPGAFFREDPRAFHIYQMLVKLASSIDKSKRQNLNELDKMGALIAQIKSVLANYRDTTEPECLREDVDLSQAVNESLSIEEERLNKAGIKVVLDLEPVPPLSLPRNKLSNVLRRLIRNAEEAMCNLPENRNRTLVIRTGEEDHRAWLAVEDSGDGLPESSAQHLFRHGYSLKGAQGDGLHYSANAMAEMDGEIRAENRKDGPGARFTLRFLEKSS